MKIRSVSLVSCILLITGLMVQKYATNRAASDGSVKATIPLSQARAPKASAAAVVVHDKGASFAIAPATVDRHFVSQDEVRAMQAEAKSSKP